MQSGKKKIFSIVSIVVILLPFCVKAVNLEEEIKQRAGNVCCNVWIRQAVATPSPSGGLKWTEPPKSGEQKNPYYYEPFVRTLPIGNYNKFLRGTPFQSGISSGSIIEGKEVFLGGSFQECGKQSFDPIVPTEQNILSNDSLKSLLNVSTFSIKSNEKTMLVKTEVVQCPKDMEPLYFSSPKEFEVDWQTETNIKVPFANNCTISGNVNIEKSYTGFDKGQGFNAGNIEDWTFKLIEPVIPSEGLNITAKPGAKFCKGRSYWCFYLRCPASPIIGFDCVTIQTKTDGKLDDECNEFVAPETEDPYSGSPFALPATKDLDLTGTSIEIFIGKAIKTAMGIIGTIALIMIIYGGGLWMLAAGNSEREGKAMKIMFTAGIGVVIILSSYAIVQFVFSAI